MVWKCSYGVVNCPQCKRPEAPIPSVYINVPYAEKDQAKAMGARWDAQNKSWYVPRGIDKNRFKRWMKQAEKPAVKPTPVARTSEVPEWFERAYDQAPTFNVKQPRIVSPKPAPTLSKSEFSYDQLMEALNYANRQKSHEEIQQEKIFEQTLKSA